MTISVNSLRQHNGQGYVRHHSLIMDLFFVKERVFFVFYDFCPTIYLKIEFGTSPVQLSG